jgi:hypothetical protein
VKPHDETSDSRPEIHCSGTTRSTGKASIRQASAICCCFVSEIGADGIREGAYGKQMGSHLVSVLVLLCASVLQEELKRRAFTGA